METLMHILEENPNATDINLAEQEIEQLDTLIPILEKTQHVKKLFLNGNKITKLPLNFGTILPNITDLDLEDNPLELLPVVTILESMINLRNLKINLEDVFEVKLILEHLNKLQFLNDEPIPLDSQSLLTKFTTETGQNPLSPLDFKKELRKVEEILYDIRKVNQKKAPLRDPVLGEEIEKLIDSTTKDFCAHSDLFAKYPVEVNNAQVLNSVLHVLNYGFLKMIGYETDPATADILEKLRVSFNYLIKLCLAIISCLNDSMMSQIIKLQSELEAANTEIRNLKLQQTSNIIYEESKQDISEDIQEKTIENFTWNESRLKGTPMKSIQTIKTISLQQLKTIIADIYIQKKKYNTKCQESGIPQETMHQFLYTYLYQQYGLKGLIYEWGTAIILATKKFTPEDADVLLFGKILINECEEKYKLHHYEIKAQIAEILKDSIRHKFKYQNENKIAGIAEKMKTEEELEEWAWTEIIKKLIPDSTPVETAIRTMIKQRQERLMMKSHSRLTRDDIHAYIRKSHKPNTIPFTHFQKFILEYELSQHLEEIQKISVEFKKCDKKKLGVLQDEKLREALVRVNPEIRSAEDLKHVLSILDPHHHQQCTFSEFIQFFF